MSELIAFTEAWAVENGAVLREEDAADALAQLEGRTA